MTKIQIDDGQEKAIKKTANSGKVVKKITVTEAPKRETEKPAPKAIKHHVARAVSSNATHSTVQQSTTLSRRYVKKPIAISVEKPVEKSTTSKPACKATSKPAKKSARVSFASKLAEKRLRAEKEQAEKAARIAQAKAEKAARVAQAKAEKAARLAAAKNARAARLTEAKKAKAAKAASITRAKNERAMKSAATVISKMSDDSAKKSPKMQHEFKKKSKAGRIFLALICSGATVAALVAFVHFSIPDLSVRVAAIQTGIDAEYPDFVPRNYNLSNVASDKEGIVVMTFSGPDGAYFTLSEEKSTWDSTALLNNYVKKNYPNDFITMREQGITIYVRGEKASWVNGGLLYKIDATGKYLTKEQIRNIATSL